MKKGCRSGETNAVLHPKTVRALAKGGPWKMEHSYDIRCCCFRKGRREKPLFCIRSHGSAEQSLLKVLVICGGLILLLCGTARLLHTIRQWWQARTIRMRERAYWRSRLCLQKARAKQKE